MANDESRNKTAQLKTKRALRAQPTNEKAKMRAPGVYAEHTEFFDLIDRRAAIVRVATGFGFTEGPVFSRLGFLLFTDLRSEKIHKWTIPPWEDDLRNGELSVFREKSNRANGLTFDHQGRLLVCETGPGRVTRTEKDGSTTVLAERHKGKRLSSPNDLIYNIDGSIYFSDMPHRNVPDANERTNVPAVYRIARSQIPGASKLELVSQECERANGVALGPQQNLLFVVDSAAKSVRVHPINSDGTLARSRVFAEFNSEERGNPDGLKTDELGNVYSTGPGGLWVFNANGLHLGTIVTPEQPSNCCWGSGGLYITARTSVYHVAARISGTRTF